MQYGPKRGLKHAWPQVAILAAVEHSGTTVLVSGGILILSWLALLFFPVSLPLLFRPSLLFLVWVSFLS